ncbi:MAG: hypothetical protein CK426_02465 [Legionella sp.]|nr:MAG: hypothetical protein CK423_03265 [Legionella sp.]PJD99660.1 MAG: hypothetical protein CK426_02465 [Legionella sp.]
MVARLGGFLGRKHDGDQWSTRPNILTAFKLTIYCKITKLRSQGIIASPYFTDHLLRGICRAPFIAFLFEELLH